MTRCSHLLLMVVWTALAPGRLIAQTATEVAVPGDPAAMADSLMARGESVAAIAAYRQALEKRPDDAELAARMALALAGRAVETPEREGDGELLREAIIVASGAVRAAPRMSRAYTALSVALGRYAHHVAHVHQVRRAREVIDLGRQAKAAADYALVLDPTDYAPHAVLGVWHRELATVHPAAKAVARWFLGGYPDVSLEDSERFLSRAVELSPDRAMLRMELAQTYLAMDELEIAKAQLRRAVDGSPRDGLDAAERERALEMLRRLP